MTTAETTMRGEAGRQGDDARSDLWVAVETRGGGGLDLDLDSTVEPYYGDSIRRQVRAVLGSVGIESARVEVRDRGALPFTIDARVEAAARAAGAAAERAVLFERSFAEPAPSARGRVRRSRLYLPGNEPKFMVNAPLHGADGLILDLEDSVHPSAKPAARLLVRNALRALDFAGAERMVRINQLPLGLDDLRVVVPELPDLVLIPKVEDPAEVQCVDAEIGRILGERSVDRPLWLMPILESALGIERAFEIARASTRVVALTIGLEDYTADLGVVKTRSGEESWWARARVVQAARAAGVQAIDSVYGDVADIDGLRQWAERSRALGFVGMGCVHPRQIGIVHDAHAPRPDEIEKALRIVAAFRDAERQGLGVVSLGSKMVDPPVVERARQLVTRARAMGLIDEQEGER